MSYAELHTVTVTTATAGGAGTEYTPRVTGRVVAITLATGETFAAGMDLAITSEDSKQNIWKEDNVAAAEMMYPVAKASTASGVASTLTESPIVVANERIKIAVTNGGDAKVGTFHIIIA